MSTYSILMLSSVPLSAPWNGADKNLARILVESDPYNCFTVQTGKLDLWPEASVRPVRVHRSWPMPTPEQKLRAFVYMTRHAARADLVHIVASLAHQTRVSAGVLRLWSGVTSKPIVHTVPSVGDGPVHASSFPGAVTVTLSDHTRRMLIDLGLSGVERVFPPLDEERLKPSGPPQQLAAELRLGMRAVLYPAHYGPESGIAEVVAAFSRLPADLNDSVLVLAPRAHAWQNARHERDKVLDVACQAGVAERVRLLDVVSDMPALISACAMTALVPARPGGKMDLPMSILESQVLRRPVVVSDRPPISEALIGQGGFAVQYGNIPALTDALARLLRSRELRHTLGAEGRKAVLRHCNPASVIERYQEFYASALASHQAARQEGGRRLADARGSDRPR